MQGDGPPYVKIGRSVRYAESALAQWMKSRMRLSTSQAVAKRREEKDPQESRREASTGSLKVFAFNSE